MPWRGYAYVAARFLAAVGHRGSDLRKISRGGSADSMPRYGSAVVWKAGEEAVPIPYSYISSRKCYADLRASRLLLRVHWLLAASRQDLAGRNPSWPAEKLPYYAPKIETIPLIANSDHHEGSSVSIQPPE